MHLWFASALLPEGWCDHVRVTVVDGAIAAIDRGVAAGPGDAREGIALPGLSNLHSHAFQRGMAGLAEQTGQGGDSFWTWRDVMYRFVDRLEPESLHAIAALAYVEMLETGFTRVGEFHYLHNDPAGMPYGDRAIMAGAIAEAARETGIALTLLPVFYAHSDFGGVPPTEGQRRFITGLDAFARLLDESRAAVAPLAQGRVGVAPHSLRAVNAEELRQVAELAAGGPIHIHIAEQTREVESCLAWSGKRPVQWLFDTADVDRRWCLVHATHVDETELARIARSGAVVGLCPITEANLGDGLFPAAGLIAANGAFGIGSDSNVLIDPAEEFRLLEYGQRLKRRGRNILATEPGQSVGASLWRRAFSGAAMALDGCGGGLAIGAPADIMSLKPRHPALIAAKGDQILDCWIFSGGRGLIDGVWRAGVKQVSDGRHHARDRVEAAYRHAMRTILD